MRIGFKIEKGMKNIFLNVKMALFLLYLFSLDEKLLPPSKQTHMALVKLLFLSFFLQEKKREMYVTGTCHVTIMKKYRDNTGRHET